MQIKKIIIFCLLFLLLLQVPVQKTGVLFSQETQDKQESNQQKVYQEPINDGPYVFRQGKKVLAHYILNSRLLSQFFEVKRSDFKVNIRPARQTYVIPTAQPAVEPSRCQGVSKIFIVSDIHGQFDRFKILLIKNKIVNKKMAWQFKKGHLVILGDVFDRGPRVTETLWTIHQLEQQAKKKGGRVHLLLGNHEVMILHGDVRYIHAKYAHVANHILKLPVEVLYGPLSVLGQWLRSKNTIIRINDILFVHGGIHPGILKRNLDMDDINRLIRDNLDTPLETIKADELLTFLFFKNGPLWYRGYFPGEDDSIPAEERYERLETPAVQQILDYFKVNYIIVGHTTQTEVTPLYDNRVFATDTGIKHGSEGEALLWNKGKFFRATVEGKKIRIK
jgi:hypothetical protein